MISLWVELASLMQKNKQKNTLQPYLDTLKFQH